MVIRQIPDISADDSVVEVDTRVVADQNGLVFEAVVVIVGLDVVSESHDFFLRLQHGFVRLLAFVACSNRRRADLWT